MIKIFSTETFLRTFLKSEPITPYNYRHIGHLNPYKPKTFNNIKDKILHENIKKSRSSQNLHHDSGDFICTQ